MSARTTASLFGVALALTVTAAEAAQEVDRNSANYVMLGCRNALDPKSVESPYLQGSCVGIIRGIAFVAALLRGGSDDDPHRRWLCASSPTEATNGQLVRVVVAYIEARPARMHESFPVLALEALRAAWPCR